jgi:hypothetical protein
MKKVFLVILTVIGAPFSILGFVLGFISERFLSAAEVGQRIIYDLADRLEQVK